LSAVCDYNVAQYKIKAYENRHVRDGADFKGVEGMMTQIECPRKSRSWPNCALFLNPSKPPKALADAGPATMPSKSSTPPCNPPAPANV